jgi:hypothetical protein
LKEEESGRFILFKEARGEVLGITATLREDRKGGRGETEV